VYDTGEIKTVYNLRVADFATYFVGGDDWGFSGWAHNTYDDWINNSGIKRSRALYNFYRTAVRKPFLTADDSATLGKLLEGQRDSRTKLGSALDQLRAEHAAYHAANPRPPIHITGRRVPTVQMTADERTAAQSMMAETPSGAPPGYRDQLGYPVRHGNVADAHLRTQKAVADAIITHHQLTPDTAIVLYNDALRLPNNPFAIQTSRIQPDVQVYAKTAGGWVRIGNPVEVEAASVGHAHKVNSYRQHNGGDFEPITYPG
jgi:hypothetical protein